jgi:hypothetical protein
MLVNPDIEEWFNRLQGRPAGPGGGGTGRSVAGLGSDVLGGIVKPGSGLFGFNAPPIRSNYRPMPIAPSPPERSPSGIPPVAPSSSGSGARDLGGGAIAAGLGKLGQGIEGGLKAFKAKQDERELLNKGYSPLPALDGPLSRQMARNPGATMPNVPPAETFPPIGSASNTPILAQPGEGMGTTGASIGPAGSLPTLAAGAPKAQEAHDPRLLNYIYGEAGNQGVAGQQAVANVLANRAAQNFRGYGTTMEAQATKGTGVFGPNSEFNGYAGAPASAISMLQQAVGNAGKDITGGATFFANPAASTASWARNLTPDNSLKIGDHYFTDNTNGTRFSASGAQPQIASPSAAAYAATAPIVGGTSELAGPPPQQNTPVPPARPTGGQEVIPGQTDPHKPGFDPSSVPFHDYSDQRQSMNDQANPLAAALAQGGDQSAPPIDQSTLLAMALSQPQQDFAPVIPPDFGGGLFSGLFG